MQMDETTQQNAALVEEATAAARSMEEQAHQLSEAVALFHLDDAAAPASAPPAPRRAAAPARAPAPKLAPAPRVIAPAKDADGGDWQEF